MDSNRIEGAARDLGGKVEDAVGGLTGDTDMQARGKAQQAFGQAQGALGELCDTVRDFATDQPFIALAVTGVFGFVLGALFTRR